MTADLSLFIDPYEAEFPSLVNELLKDANTKSNICATVVPHGRCILIYNNHLYVWSCTVKDTGIPHATRMDLPSTGLKYSTQLVCLFSKGPQYKHLSLLAISPEGTLRYWAELGKQARNESCLLNNEVAKSVQLVDSQEQFLRFLISTTTGSFHMVDLFHSGPGQLDRLAIRPLDIGGPGGGIGRRMSILLFGSSSMEKEQIIKTLNVAAKLPGGLSDVVNVLPRYLRFFSIFEQRRLNHEVDITDMALAKYNKNRERTERRLFFVVDAVQYRTGILLLMVGSKPNESQINTDPQLFVAYYEEIVSSRQQDIPQRMLKSLIHVPLPESLYAIGMEKRLSSAQLHCTTQEECCIVFHDSLILVRHPNNQHSFTTLVLDSYITAKAAKSSANSSRLSSPVREVEEILLGAAPVHGFCNLVLKEAGVCVLRRLPRHFDLNFWRRHRLVLNQMDTLDIFSGESKLFRESFVDFCAKDLKQAKIKLRELFDRIQHSSAAENEEERRLTAAVRLPRNTLGGAPETNGGMAVMALDLLLHFLDRQPADQEDPRWAYSPDKPISSEQKNQLKTLAETRKFHLVLRQLGDKLAYYRMFILFLRTFSLIDWIDQPLQAFQRRSGKAVMAELGEKLVSMDMCFRWLSEHSQSIPLVIRAFGELAKQYQTKYGLPKSNPFLSSTDLVFTRVSTFHELVSCVVQTGEQAMEEDGSTQNKTSVLSEICAFFVTLIEGVHDAKHKDWTLQATEDDERTSTWLNQPDFLTHFVTQLNTALDFLASIATSSSSNELNQLHKIIFDHCIHMANFVLSQQSISQRNDSKIIARFASLGRQDIALELAERYKDFTFLVVYCHNKLDKRRCQESLGRYKKEFEKDGFHDFLYAWYQQKGMFSQLLAERGDKVNHFLAQRQQLNWIRQIEEGKYGQARSTLTKMAAEEKDERKRLIELSLCKMAALCEEQENVTEIAELSENIRELHNKRREMEKAQQQETEARDGITEGYPYSLIAPPQIH